MGVQNTDCNKPRKSKNIEFQQLSEIRCFFIVFYDPDLDMVNSIRYWSFTSLNNTNLLFCSRM